MLKRAMCMMVGLITTVGIAALPATTSAGVIWTDDFESYTDFNSLYSVWGQNPAALSSIAGKSALGTIAHSGDQSMAIRGNGQMGARSLGGTYHNGETIDVTAYIYLGANSATTFSVVLGSDDANHKLAWNTYQARVQFQLGQSLKYYMDGSASAKSASTDELVADQWYKIRIVATPSQAESLYDVYLNGVKVVTGAKYVDNSYGTSTLGFMSLLSTGVTLSGEEKTQFYYVDDVSVSVTPVPSPSSAGLATLGLLGLAMSRYGRKVIL